MKQGFMYPRLASNLLCGQEWPKIFDSLASLSNLQGVIDWTQRSGYAGQILNLDAFSVQVT